MLVLSLLPKKSHYTYSCVFDVYVCMATGRRNSERFGALARNPRQNLESFACIWLDQHLFTIDDNQLSLQRLRSVINHVQLFDQINRCIDCIRSIVDEQIILIVSGSLGREILPVIHNLPQFSACYVFCGDVAVHRQWSCKYPKVNIRFGPSIEMKHSSVCIRPRSSVSSTN